MCVSWFNLSQQLSTTQPLAHFSTIRILGRIGRIKVRKCVDWDKDSLIGKAMHTSKAEQGIHSLFHMSRQVNRAPPCIMVTWDVKCHHSKCPTLPSFPLFIYSAWCHNSMGISLWSVWVSCPSCVSSQLLVHLQHPHQCDSRRTEKPLMLCKHHSAIMKIPLHF